MKTFKKNYPKIHKACEMHYIRPEFEYVYISKEVIKATDTRVLIQHKTSEVFGKEFIESLPKKPILIHRIYFAEMTRYGCELHNIGGNMIRYRYRGLLHYVPFQVDGKEISYMKTDKIWPKKVEAIEVVGISPKILNKAFEALDYGTTRAVKFQFHSQSKAIILTIQGGNYQSAKALVMPVMMWD